MVRKLYNPARARFLRGLTLGSLGFCTASAVDVAGRGPEWLEIVHLDLPVQNLAKSFAGVRLVHISDLHYSTTVSRAYLTRCFERINKLKPDIIALTGDFVTYDRQGRFKTRIIDLLNELHARLGVFACLGNHDYGVREPGRTYTVGELVSSLQKTGLYVLRNQAKAISLDHGKLWIVGLGDFWVGDCQPMRAFNSVPADSAKITLVHNPDAIDLLRHTNADAILSGHTHGVNITSSRQLQKISAYTGMARVDGKVLYINRGLGRHGRPRLRCRPEITVFTLKSSPSAPNAT